MAVFGVSATLGLYFCQLTSGGSLYTNLSGPEGSRCSTTDRASECQLEPTRPSSAEAKKTNPSSE